MRSSPKLGVITDGISRDLPHALDVMLEYGLHHPELQYIGNKEVGDLSEQEIRAAKAEIRTRNMEVSSISRHLFAGMPMATSEPGDTLHTRHMDALKRCIDMALELDCQTVRIMTGKKEMILWGSHGAEKWNVAHGAWDKQLALTAPAVELAREHGVTLVNETGNGIMVHSAWTARKLIDDLDAKDTLKVLWDPANACFCHETAYPDAYELLRDGYIGHVHIKDVQVDTPKARLEVRPMGKGQLADAFPKIGAALKADGYTGAVSFEGVYHSGDGDYEAGFRGNVDVFMDWFG
ncbi:MAG: sugar phosphate isomerase/epimerase family protein [Pseudomonadota bacterium]